MTLQTVALLVLVLPALGALALAFGAQRMPRIAVKIIGPGVVWLAFLCTLYLLADSLSNGGAAHDFSYWTWIRSGSFQLPFNLYVDRLAVFMCLVVTGVGGLIVTYAVGYMEHEDNPSYARFFCYLDLFLLAMLLLVLAGNLVFLIIGWAGVGLSSYLLIGFWYWRHAAVVAARKAFVMNVIGDVGMILGTFVLFLNYKQVTYPALFAALPHVDGPWLEVAGFLFLVGAVAKSAQLPLHTWLPDAMEGPTPVSALIHAATMVTAGVYLVGRLHPMYDVAIWSHGAVAVIGAATALFAATIGLVQTDIKRVLAYSTMSQIGYMFLAVGVGAYAAGFYHLIAHAFFKALLFMAAGNVIHAMHDEQDMRKFGGLWKDMRVSSVCFLVGALSLAGIIPFVGFFSKEMILGETFSKGGAFPLAMWAVGFVTAALTAFYTGRMWWMAFWRKKSDERPVDHPHEAQAVMLIPVTILAVLATVFGFAQTTALTGEAGPQAVSGFLEATVGRIDWQASPLEVPLTLVTLVLGILFFLAAYNYYVADRWKPWSSAVPWLQTLLERKYYLDEIYNAVFVRTLDAAANDGDKYVEEPVLDQGPVAVGTAAADLGKGVSATQSGYFRTYAIVILIGLLIGAAILLIKAVS